MRPSSTPSSMCFLLLYTQSVCCMSKNKDLNVSWKYYRILWFQQNCGSSCIHQCFLYNVWTPITICVVYAFVIRLIPWHQMWVSRVVVDDISSSVLKIFYLVNRYLLTWAKSSSKFRKIIVIMYVQISIHIISHINFSRIS